MGDMRTAALALCALALLLTGASAARAAAPPAGAVLSENLEYVNGIRDPGTVHGNFDRVGRTDVMLVVGKYGLRSYDLTNPAQPQVLDTWLPADVLPNGAWESEDVDIDTRRKLVIVSLDPRHDDAEQAKCPGIGTLAAKNRNPSCDSGFFVVSYANPADLKQVGDFVETPAGHTSSCIDGCRWIWTGGPARRDDMTDPSIWPVFTAGGRGDGRPVWVTDLRDPAKPKVLPKPIDLYRNDGATDYSHDVQVDGDGIAWTSGRGGVLGYATRGKHRDPRTGRKRHATPADPVLVAGGGVDGVAVPSAMFMHNSLRPTGRKSGVRAAGVAPGGVLISTEEQFSSDCTTDGRVVFSDLTDSVGGRAAATSTPEKPYRMKALDWFHPTLDEPGTVGADASCSAHYFDLAGSMLATTWYGQGTRFLDVSNARDVRQVAYFRVDGQSADQPSSSAFAVRYRGDLVYVFDINRGIDILKFKGRRGHHGGPKMRSVKAPPVRKGSARYAARIVDGGPRNQLVCPLLEPVSS